jgi:hypothetical protein
MRTRSVGVLSLCCLLRRGFVASAHTAYDDALNQTDFTGIGIARRRAITYGRCGQSRIFAAPRF